MKRGRLLVLFGSICLVLILVMLPVMAGCKGAEEAVVEGEEEEEEAAPKLPSIKVIYSTMMSSTAAAEKHRLELVDRWEEATPNYHIDFEPHYAYEIFPGAQQIEALATGSIHWAATGGYTSEAFEPRHGIFSVPLLFDVGPFHITRFCATPEWQKVEADHEKDGVKTIGLAEGDLPSDYSMWLMCIKKPVNCLEDLAGMRIRAMESPTMISALESLGATPLAVVMAELTIAMQTGMIDALIGAPGPSWIRMLGYLDYAKWAVEYPPLTSSRSGFPAVNAQWWYGLPDEVRDGFLAVYPDWIAEDRIISKTDRVINGHQMMRDNIPCAVLSEEEVERWFEALKPCRDLVAKRVGQDLIEAALRTREETRADRGSGYHLDTPESIRQDIVEMRKLIEELGF